MSTKAREVLWGGRIMGAKMRAEMARQEARKADRAEAEVWAVRMEGYGGPAQPSTTIGQGMLTEQREITPYNWVHPDEER